MIGVMLMNKKHLPIWANKSEGDYPSFTGNPARVLVVWCAKGNKATLTNYWRKALAFFRLRLVLKKWRPFGHLRW